jgi:hypothetical protein
VGVFLTVDDFLASVGLLLAPEAGRLLLAIAFAATVAEFTVTPVACILLGIAAPDVAFVAPDFVVVAVLDFDVVSILIVFGGFLVTVILLPLILAAVLVTFLVVAITPEPLPLNSVGAVRDFVAPALLAFGAVALIAFGIVVFTLCVDDFDVAFFRFLANSHREMADEDSKLCCEWFKDGIHSTYDTILPEEGVKCQPGVAIHITRYYKPEILVFIRVCESHQRKPMLRTLVLAHYSGSILLLIE